MRYFYEYSAGFYLAHSIPLPFRYPKLLSLQMVNHVWSLLTNCEALDVGILTETAHQSCATLNRWWISERFVHSRKLENRPCLMQRNQQTASSPCAKYDRRDYSRVKEIFQRHLCKHKNGPKWLLFCRSSRDAQQASTSGPVYLFYQGSPDIRGLDAQER